MPLYEYRCEECGEVVEKLQQRPRAPKCCGGKMERLPSVSNFALKGGGWEKDGYDKVLC